MKLTIFFVLFLNSVTAFASVQSYSCKSVQSNSAGDLNLYSYDLKLNGNSAEVLFQTSAAPLLFENANADIELDGNDQILSIQHEAFSMVISLSNEYKQAVINPFVWKEKKYGPFAFECK